MSVEPVAPVVPAAPAALPSPAREAAVAAAGLVVLVMVGYGALLGVDAGNLHNGLLALAFTAVGLYVLRARPGHRLARLFVGLGLAAGVMYLGRQYALHDDPLPGADWLAWVSITPVPLVMALSGVAILIFPTGRPLTPRWGVVAVVMVVLGLLLTVVSALWPIEDDWRTGDYSFPFRFGDPEAARRLVEPVMLACYQGFLVVWVAAVAARFRRAVGDETRQLRWFVYAVAVVAVVSIGGMAVLGTPVPGLIATPLIPLAAGAAVLKLRLYDIDPVIDKTLVIGAMALLVTAGYVTVVLGVGALLPVPDGSLALAATALVAVAFEPLRRRAQRAADRLVYGRRATPYEALAELSRHVGDPEQELLAGMVATVARAVGASRVTLWTGAADATSVAAVWPRDAAPGPAPGGGTDPRERVVQVVHGGEVRGALVVRKKPGEPVTAADERLLRDLAAQAALVLELRAAARRIVTAHDAARARIERDLHDGAQQRLLTLGMDLGVIAARAEQAGDAELADQARRARDEALAATTELRELARGLRPPVLAEAGLPAALAALADRSALPVRLRAAVDERPSADVEATAYFVVSEALANAARHAEAAVVCVDVGRVDDELIVTVTDDGRGGARVGHGSGLQGLADRVAALGGWFSVDSPPGGGTTVRAVLPCG